MMLCMRYSGSLRNEWDYNQKMISPRSGFKAIRFSYSLIKNQISFTESFTKALARKLQDRQQGQFLRLEISAGEGCEGYTYKFKFDSTLNKHDYVSMGEDQKVVFALSEEELGLVKGSTLDYIKEMMRESFYVKQNPNAEISCSCKTSFSPKEFLL